MKFMLGAGLGLLFLATSGAALAHGISAGSDADVDPAFDVTSASATTDGRLATFAVRKRLAHALFRRAGDLGFATAVVHTP